LANLNSYAYFSQDQYSNFYKGKMSVKKPTFLLPTDEVTIVGNVFDTQLVVKGKTWFPLTELVVWAMMTWFAGKGYPARSWRQRIGVGALTTFVMLGSEWCHNLAHAAVARWINKPMDALRIVWGMPLVVYYNPENESVTPRQHIMRALGGPLWNALMLKCALWFKCLTRPSTPARDVANVAVGMNTLLCTASLLPIPGIDGGPILKWSLVEGGRTPQEADEMVKRVNQWVGGGLGIASWIALKKRSWLLGVILGLFAVLSLAIGIGVIKEQEERQ
jgi:Zn-dependent protease